MNVFVFVEIIPCEIILKISQEVACSDIYVIVIVIIFYSFRTIADDNTRSFILGELKSLEALIFRSRSNRSDDKSFFFSLPR